MMRASFFGSYRILLRDGGWWSRDWGTGPENESVDLVCRSLHALLLTPKRTWVSLTFVQSGEDLTK